MSLMRSQVVFHQRRQAAADTKIDARMLVGGVRGVHVVALFAGHHLQCQFVVIAQENRPLAALGNVGRLLHNLGDGITVFLCDRHVDARHEREVKRHVALVAIAEILAHILRPLVGFGEQEAVLVLRVDRCTQLA